MATGAGSFPAGGMLGRLVRARTLSLLLLLLGVPAVRASYHPQGGGECQGKTCAGKMSLRHSFGSYS